MLSWIHSQDGFAAVIVIDLRPKKMVVREVLGESGMTSYPIRNIRFERICQSSLDSKVGG